MVREIKFPLKQDEKRKANEYLRMLNVDMKKPIILLHPGAAYGSSKRWPVQKYARLADLFYERDQASILIIGSLDEVETAEALCSAVGTEPINLAGKTSLRLLAGLISHASLFVSNDSGPMHMANALKVPVVALFGPSDPSMTRPFQQPSTVIKKSVPCWPCSYRVCPFDHRCMMNIEPEEVYEAGKKYLG